MNKIWDNIQKGIGEYEKDIIAMSITKLELIDGKLPLHSVIGRLNDMRPDIKELEDFDHSKANDTTYCIEWGMKKQKWIEQAIYDRTLADLNAL